MKTHLSDDLSAITERAYRVWPQRLRGSFTLLKQKGIKSAVKLKKSYKKLGPVHEKYTLEYRDDEPNMTEDADSDVESEEEEGVDVFFDALDNPLNESDDESSTGSSHASDWEPLKEQIESPPSRQSDDSSRPEILKEFPLPRMFIPGSIAHIYTYRGGYKAALVPRTFRSLRRISLAGRCEISFSLLVFIANFASRLRDFQVTCCPTIWREVITKDFWRSRPFDPPSTNCLSGLALPRIRRVAAVPVFSRGLARQIQKLKRPETSTTAGR